MLKEGPIRWAGMPKDCLNPHPWDHEHWHTHSIKTETGIRTLRHTHLHGHSMSLKHQWMGPKRMGPILKIR